MNLNLGNEKGKKVDEVWVFGGKEWGSKMSFFEIVEERSAATLIPIIKIYVIPGSIILSDCWKTELFKNKETGACTNLIESTWNAVKKSLPKNVT